MSRLGIVDRRIRALEKGQQRNAAFVQGNDWYALRVSPSCPPDKRVHLRGGLAYCSYQSAGLVYNQRAYTIPSLTADLADASQVVVDVTFANANWYLAYVLLLQLPATEEEPTESDWSFWLWGTGTELETAGEAEAHMEWDTLAESDPWKTVGNEYHGYPLCGLILRNDGTVGSGCNILPVDVMNRGRSYTWPRDVRPRRYIER